VGGDHHAPEQPTIVVVEFDENRVDDAGGGLIDAEPRMRPEIVDHVYPAVDSQPDDER